MILYKAKRKDNGEWIEGYIFKLKGKDQSFIFTGEFDITGSFPAYVRQEINPNTICRCVGKQYRDGEIAYEGDIFENPSCGVKFILKYGSYMAYCPADDEYMENVGFYAESIGYPQMPIGCLEEYALKIGNVYDNPELIKV